MFSAAEQLTSGFDGTAAKVLRGLYLYNRFYCFQTVHCFCICKSKVVAVDGTFVVAFVFAATNVHFVATQICRHNSPVVAAIVSYGAHNNMTAFLLVEKNVSCGSQSFSNHEEELKKKKKKSLNIDAMILTLKVSVMFPLVLAPILNKGFLAHLKSRFVQLLSHKLSLLTAMRYCVDRRNVRLF